MAETKNNKSTNRTTIKKGSFLKALEETHGNITDACSASNVSRSAYYDWMEKDKEFKVTVDDIVEGVIDHVESKLFENINKNDTTSIIFFLKTRGKKRGYVERQEIEFENPITGIKFIDA